MDPIHRQNIELSRQPKISRIDDLPDELKIKIAQNLNFDSRTALGLASKEWKRITSDEHFFPINRYKQEFPDVFERVVKLIKAETFPKRESLRTVIWRLFKFNVAKSKDETSKFTSLESRFMSELNRIIKDYDLPKEYRNDIDKIKEHIQRRQDLGLCQFCRILFTVSRISMIQDRTEEAKQWREYLKSIDTKAIDWRPLVYKKGKLNYLPPEIELFENLQELYIVRSRELKCLPPEIGNLQNLIELQVQKSSLKSLPPEIGQLLNLKSLYIRSDQELSIPSEILNCKKLKNIYLINTKLTTQSQEILQKLKKQNNIRF